MLDSKIEAKRTNLRMDVKLRSTNLSLFCLHRIRAPSVGLGEVFDSKTEGKGWHMRMDQLLGMRSYIYVKIQSKNFENRLR